MKETIKAKENHFLKYWERRFDLILQQNTNWNKLYFSLNKDIFPETIDIDYFCIKHSQELNLKFNYKVDQDAKHYNITITK
ncbi:hypothetical protein [Faecalibacter macacae]|uniref:Uncharacterized protein n=1 Tax=Faecalibacter macacae TaxID=1859289 RepID=A0A3L9M770_9FLAO|nr:hypothetical protein [Faecalibacter macacae]RLZ07114.1 hypothetical protein EAH69_11730 [Faecalibacter macacae]